MSPERDSLGSISVRVPQRGQHARMRVLHLIDSGGLYGIERMLLALLPALERQGIQIALGCLGRAGTPEAAVAAAARDLGLDSFELGMSPGVSPMGLVRVARCLMTRRPTIVHAHGYKATTLGGAMAWALGVSTVATYHGEAARTTGLGGQLALESPVIRRISAVAAVSEAIARELVGRGVAKERVRVIPNGIPCPPQARRSRERVSRLAIVGRLVPGKNVHLLLEVLAELRVGNTNLHLIVVGDGPCRGELEGLTRDLGLTDSVVFAGFVDDVPALLATVDAFVMPSQTEGMPLALLEAMAVGVPVVASAVGSIPVVARHGVEALLVPPDDKAALRSALAELVADPIGADRRAECARLRFLEHYTSDSMAAEYAALYRSLHSPT